MLIADSVWSIRHCSEVYLKEVIGHDGFLERVPLVPRQAPMVYNRANSVPLIAALPAEEDHDTLKCDAYGVAPETDIEHASRTAMKSEGAGVHGQGR